MNELVIPPAPLWYKSSVLVCSPDNVLVYGSKSDIIVIRDRGTQEPPEITIIQAAHTKNITSLSLNKKWKDPYCHLVSLGEDSVIKVWNLENFEKKFSNKEHVEHKQPVVGAVFAGDDRVVSAAENGLIIIWNINTNESKVLKDLFNSKVSLTCLSSCPHAGWLLAFGLNNGCVIVADLRRNGQVLYRLRGHYKAVVSLSWCPAPVNIFPRHTQNTVKNKSDDTKDIQEKQNKKVGQSPEKCGPSNPWVNLTHSDDGEVPPEEHSLEESVNDFLKECDDLKSKILGLETPNGATEEEDTEVKEVMPKIKHQYEEKGIEETEGTEASQKVKHDRPLPILFDPSGDFLDDLNPVEEIFEDKDVGTEKNTDSVENKDEEDAEASEDKEHSVEDKGKGDKTDIEATGESSGITVDDSPTTKTEVTEEEPRTEYLLASAGKDRSVYIWRAGTDGRMQTFFHTPKKSKSKDSKNANLWIAICWISPGTLLTSSVNGEVLAWPLPKPKESSKQHRIIHCEHSSTIFNMASPSSNYSSYNWRNKTDLTFWTFSQDGLLINYDMNAQKVVLCYSTITAPVTCVNSSALDPNRLAIGIRDGSIRVWDLSLPHSKIIAMHKFHQKVTHKVSTIAWNPVKEMILGFGTEEGRVGFIDMISKKSTLFPHYFRTQVYKVEWGPLQDVDNLGLYVVVEGKVAVYNIQEPNNDPTHLALPEQMYVYKFAWKPDLSLLLLNGNDGSLAILTNDLIPVTTVYLSDKGLNDIVWHPDAFTNKTEVSSRCYWFAATTNKGLLVYDCASVQDNATEDRNHMDSIVVTFEGHLRPPISLTWCPFDGNKLVSTAPDGLVHVWDVVSKCAISTFVDPYMYYNPAVVWSPIDPDLIIIGDKIIRVWSISKNPPKVDDEFLASRKRLLTKSPKTDTDKGDNTIKIDIPHLKSSPKNCIVPAMYVSNDDNLALQIANMRKLMNGEESKGLSEESNKLDPLLLFGEKEQVSQLLLANYAQQKKENKHKSCQLISLWKGNIGEFIQEAINENRVTPVIISLAPMVSPKLWQDACEVYAKKLSETGNSDPLETAMYFLACHKVEEAINCLCLGSLFKEALALAKQRLPESSEIITGVTEKWAQYCIGTGNFENAAFCYISIGQYLEAAKVLARRNNKEFLEFAAELADKAGNKGLYDSIMFKYNEVQRSSQEVEEVEETYPSRAEAVLKEVSSNNETEETHKIAEVNEPNLEENTELTSVHETAEINKDVECNKVEV